LTQLIKLLYKFYFLYFCNIVWWWPKLSAETCRVYKNLMNVRTFMLLYWSGNLWKDCDFVYNVYFFHCHVCYRTRPSYPSLDHGNNAMRQVYFARSLITKIYSSFCVFCPISDPNILLSIISSEALSLGLIITHYHCTTTLVGLIYAYLFTSKLPTHSGHLKWILRKSLKYTD
jgi:hypothetical protein